MKGAGWECDHCGTRAITESRYGLSSQPPPEGWLILLGPAGAPETSSLECHYCSLRCVLLATTAAPWS